MIEIPNAEKGKVVVRFAPKESIERRQSVVKLSVKFCQY